MTNNIPQIMTLSANNIFEYCEKKENNYLFDINNKISYRYVVKQIADFNECPLYHQILFETQKRSGDTSDSSWLLDKLIIVDFEKIFQFLEKEDVDKQQYLEQQYLEKNVQDLIENGLDIQYEKDRLVHFIPFDKSGNMSRNSRITFIREDYFQDMNKRLNLGIDFSQISVVLSKYYAYRGLYLSSSKRIDHEDIKITPETLIIINEKRVNGNGSYLLGRGNEINIPIVTAEEIVTAEGKESGNTNKSNWKFKDAEIKAREYVQTPFDGVGMISPEYAGRINEKLHISGATSFQVRMPFIKGMLHKVNFKSFIEEYDEEGWEEKKYDYVDAFGITRNLKEAHILLTESMFKGMKWIKEYCDEKNIKDPMEFYCDALNKYRHSLYVGGTNLPYGHSKYTHLSYQMVNTLKLSDEEFEKVMKSTKEFVKDPLQYVKEWNSEEAIDFEDSDRKKLESKTPTWKKAVIKDETFQNDIYIAEQLKNIQKGLITKIANGKIPVIGQTRYLCRDLMPLLALLLKNPKKVGEFYRRCLFMRFYLPLGKKDAGIFKGNKNYKYSGYAAFFRSPHLARNEECLLQPFLKPGDEETFFRTDKMPTQEQYERYVEMYGKYFRHLTGVVMVPRGSTVPLCLGGADFDGDLVQVVFDETVVQAVHDGCYANEWLKRELPIIKIPETKAKEETVPKQVPYEHIRNTFSNSIGLISNEAISIAQKEYSSDEPSEGKLACWMCTLLTGLDIDAAKNGKHPDLSMLLSQDIPKSGYLKFIKQFEALRSDDGYKFDNLCVKNDKVIEVSLKNSKKNPAVFVLPEEPNTGTKVNQLPVLFAEEYIAYQNKLREKKEKGNTRCSPFRPFKNNAYGDDDKVREFKEKYDSIIRIYSFYKTNLLTCLKIEKNNENHGEENLYELILKIYDKENAEYLWKEIIPELERKLESAIVNDINDIKKNFNEVKWQFQPQEEREKKLDDIIGSEVSDSLSDAEKNLLFHFNQGGYKILWHLIDIIKGKRVEEFETIKARVEEKNKDLSEKEKKGEFAKRLEEVVKAYYDSNLKNVDLRLYKICIERLRKLVEDTSLSPESKVGIMYQVTAKSSTRRKIFWDLFSWEEIEKCLKTEEDENAK